MKDNDQDENSLIVAGKKGNDIFCNRPVTIVEDLVGWTKDFDYLKAQAIGETLAAIAKWDIFFILLTLCLAVTFLTEMTSNTATTSLLMPILAVTAVAASIDPKLLMIPAAMSASCAFMLPVATAPNVVVFSTGKFGIERMIREGFALNIIGALVISTLSYFLLT